MENMRTEAQCLDTHILQDENKRLTAALEKIATGVMVGGDDARLIARFRKIAQEALGR